MTERIQSYTLKLRLTTGVTMYLTTFTDGEKVSLAKVAMNATNNGFIVGFTPGKQEYLPETDDGVKVVNWNHVVGFTLAPPVFQQPVDDSDVPFEEDASDDPGFMVDWSEPYPTELAEEYCGRNHLVSEDEF